MDQRVHEKLQRRVRYLFFGLSAELEEQFNRECKQGWMFAADAARITGEVAGSEDRKHTSGGVFIAVDSNLGAAVGEEDGAVASSPGNEDRITQAWVNVRGGMRVFSVYFWHSEGWIPRNEAMLEAVLKRELPDILGWWHVTVIWPQWNLKKKKKLWFQRNRMHVVAPEKASTWRSKSAKGEWIEKVYDYVIACNSLKGKISQMDVVEDFEQSSVLLWWKEKRRWRNGTSRSCRRCYPVTVEEGCQEEAQKKNAEKKVR